MKEFNLIREWAQQRGLYEKGNPNTQYVKLQEEAGELAKALLKNDEPEIVDAIGDIVVVLTNLAHLKGYKIEDCIESAYNEIKNRKGSMVNGTFVKQDRIIVPAEKHKNGYYNLPCKYKDINNYLETKSIKVGDTVFDNTNYQELLSMAKPSINGGVAYVPFEADL